MARTKVFNKDYLMDELDVPYENIQKVQQNTRMKDLGSMMMRLNVQK